MSAARRGRYATVTSVIVRPRATTTYIALQPPISLAALRQPGHGARMPCPSRPAAFGTRIVPPSMRRSIADIVSDSDCPMLWLKLAAAFLCSVTMLAARDVPAGTALPVMLNSTLDAKKDKPGEKIQGKVMQDVPLPSGAKIKSGSRVSGHVVSVNKLAGGVSSRNCEVRSARG